MAGGVERKPGADRLVHLASAGAGALTPGKRTLTEQLPGERDSRTGAAEQALRAMAPRFGLSFDRVRVHADATGEARAAAHGTPAVAEGEHIYLGHGVDLERPAGQRILAHELAHVVQQTAPDDRAGGAPRVADAGALEAEAHEVGDAVAAGGTAAPSLRTGGARAQGYGSPEHQAMGNDVASILEPVVARGGELGGVSAAERTQQEGYEQHANHGSHQPGWGRVRDLANGYGVVKDPQLQDMLARDPFTKDRARSLTISVRNFKLETDVAGPYLGIEIDPSTKQAARYDVPVSPGDLTAMNGDLYGSVENMRKAPVAEVVELQKLLDLEAAWERGAMKGEKPNFDTLYDQATAWRGQPVYGAGKELGKQADATGGDASSYVELALHNEAHFGQGTEMKHAIEERLTVAMPETVDALAKAKQGNAQSGNEMAWLAGHARALILAREAHDIAHGTAAQKHKAQRDHYGHETEVPDTGLLDSAKGGAKLAPVAKSNPNSAQLPDAKAEVGIRRSATGPITSQMKLNDAYVENAGADHYLTDAFAAGHQLVRSTIGSVLDDFVADKGGQGKFLDYVADKIQDGAIADKEHAKGQLGDFQDASRAWTWNIAKGTSWVNFAVDGLKQTLAAKIDATKMRGIGAKLVHDYYNKRGMVVHNKKGAAFVIKGDGHADEAPEAREIIALAVLASRDQITQLAATGTMPSPLDVWAYTPDLDKTQFTRLSGRAILEYQFADSTYLWNLIKGYFTLGDAPVKGNQQDRSKYNRAQQGVAKQPGKRDGKLPADVGTSPLKTWFARRQAYVQQFQGQAHPGKHRYRDTADGVTIPVEGA
jgi:hypothetical protein